MRSSQDPLFVQDEIPIRDQTARRCAVELVTGHTIPVAGSAPSAEGFRSYLLVYGRNGNRIRQEKFNSEDSVIWRCAYDGDGRLRKEITFQASGEDGYQLDILYDSDYWNEKLMYSAPGRIRYRIVAIRHTSGRLLQAVYYDPAGLPIRTDSYSYNSLGQLVRVDMGSMGECLYEYDKKQNIIRRSRYLPGASVYGDVAEFEYDEQGLLARMENLHHSVISFSLSFF